MVMYLPSITNFLLANDHQKLAHSVGLCLEKKSSISIVFILKDSLNGLTVWQCNKFLCNFKSFFQFPFLILVHNSSKNNNWYAYILLPSSFFSLSIGLEDWEKVFFFLYFMENSTTFLITLSVAEIKIFKLCCGKKEWGFDKHIYFFFILVIGKGKFFTRNHWFISLLP